jgi:hypothetical protein
MSPFWWLAAGLGVAFLITTGRAQAMYTVITQAVDIAPPSTPGTTPGQGPSAGPCQSYMPQGSLCKAGYIFDVQTGLCVCYAGPGTSKGTGVPG